MTKPREILEAALREPLDVEAARRAIRDALAALPPVEADAARWAGFRHAAAQQSERFVDAMAGYPIADPDRPTAAEMDAAADAGLAALYVDHHPV